MEPLTQLSPKEAAWRSSVRAFAESKLRARVMAMDEAAAFPSDVLGSFFTEGLMAIHVPTAYGGAGRSFFDTILAIEELARVDPAAAVCVDVQNALVAVALLRYGTEEQKRRYLPRLARDTIGAYALSERGAGSDGFAVTTRAERAGSDFVLQGEKYWTTNAAEAGVFLVVARTTEGGQSGLTAFIVDRETPGVGIGPRERKLGIRASSTCAVSLDGVRVPARNVLGALGQGGEVAVDTLNEGRVGIAAQMLGLAQGAFEAAYAYANQRQQFGQHIVRFQAVHFALARMATEVEAARLVVYNAARIYLAQPTPLERFRWAAMGKYFASQVAERVASEALEIFGGNGFIKDYPAEKFYRDAKIGRIYEGTTNMLLRTIATTLSQAYRPAAVREDATQGPVDAIP